jgi:hypothetical protein
MYGLVAADTGDNTVARKGAAAVTLSSLATPTNITAGTITTVTTLPAITTDWITAAGVSAAAVTKIIDAITAAAPGVTGAVNDETASATEFDTNLASTVDDFYNGAYILFTSGALLGQSRKISDYDGTGKTITVASAFSAAPANGAAFIILGRSE